MNQIGSLCPTLKASDIIGDKWILLILREFFLGAHRYSEIQNALPNISPTVLSKRLKTMQKNGLIVHEKSVGQQKGRYFLTPSAKELGPIIDQLARWGLRWARDQMCDINIDAGAFMWDFHRTMRADQLPDGTHVICVILTDQSDANKWWVIVNNATVDLCNEDPGRDVGLYVTATLTALAEVWMGDTPLATALKSKDIVLSGVGYLQKGAEAWFPYSRYIEVKAASGD